MIQDFLSFLFGSNYLMYVIILIIINSVQYHLYIKRLQIKSKNLAFQTNDQTVMSHENNQTGEKLLAVFIKSIQRIQISLCSLYWYKITLGSLLWKRPFLFNVHIVSSFCVFFLVFLFILLSNFYTPLVCFYPFFVVFVLFCCCFSTGWKAACLSNCIKFWEVGLNVIRQKKTKYIIYITAGP